MDFILINYIWIGVALITFLSLVVFKIRAPYGRHSSESWGPMISNKWGWFFMELPALVLMPLIAFMGDSDKNEIIFRIVSECLFLRLHFSTISLTQKPLYKHRARSYVDLQFMKWLVLFCVKIAFLMTRVQLRINVTGTTLTENCRIESVRISFKTTRYWSCFSGY